MARKDDARDAETPQDESTKAEAAQDGSKGASTGGAAQAADPKADAAKSTTPKSTSVKSTSATAGADGTELPKTTRTTATGTAPESLDDLDLAEDSGATLGADEEVPYELAEDTPNPEELPETGLVSEFVDVGRRQAAWLVSNRESSTAMRSPLFLVTVAVIVLGIIAALISGIVRNAQAETGTPSMAMVGVGEQAATYEQQLGVSITDVPDAQTAEQLVRNGTVDAAFIQDPTGQAQPTIIALDRQPEALLERLAPQTEATLLLTPAVSEDIATPILWGMVVFSLLVIATLGTALYQNLRLEKRNRITEIIAATIPPRAAASGRVTGMLTLVVIHLVVVAVVVELGLSISGQTSLAFSMLPGLGWYALTFFFTAWTVFALLVWASTLTGDRTRKIVLAIIGVLTVGGALAPVIIGASGTVARVLSWTPFTSPLGIAGRFFSAQPQWWEGLVAAGIAAVLALIVHALAGSAYVRSVLSGGGRAGRTVKLSKRARKAAAKEDAAKDAEAKDSGAKDADAKDGGAKGSGTKDSGAVGDAAEDDDASDDAATKSGAATAKTRAAVATGSTSAPATAKSAKSGSTAGKSGSTAGKPAAKSARSGSTTAKSSTDTPDAGGADVAGTSSAKKTGDAARGDADEK